VKVGLALPCFELGTGRPLSLAEIAEVAAEAEEAGFDSLWTMDHYFLDNVPGRTAAHEPFITLAYLAGRTERVQLGTLVACNGFRPVGQLARAAASLADAAEGRFVLGLGSGWQQSEFDAFGHPFDRRAERLAETLEVLGGLMRGSDVTHDGRFSRLRRARITTSAAPPTVWVAAFRPRMVAIAARFADGWNSSWHGPDTTRFVQQLETMRAGLAAVGRAGDAFEVSAGLWMLPVEGDELAAAVARADSLKPPSADATWPSPILEKVLSGEAAALAAAVRIYERLGAGHVILNLSVTPFSLFDRSYVERTRQVLELLRR
jgi:alkanesulfonate monooxygenase SsuD/methylene tetrahydromethanopterin reductase-like flavin-dependent oxidoreductase (luciferase family)